MSKIDKINKVILISPSNQKIECFYWELEDICKSICLEDENQEKFLEFSKDYTYFNGYFDFVMFELKYILGNALCEENLFMIVNDNALFGIDSKYCDDINYSKLSQVDKKFLYHIPIMTKCSNQELDIHPFNSKMKASMIDANGMCMMSHSGIPNQERGSHMVTCRTILNQILIQNKRVVKHYLETVSNPIDYLVTNLGFIRTTSKVEGGLAIGNKINVSTTVFDKINNTKGFHFIDKKELKYADLKEEYITRRR